MNKRTLSISLLVAVMAVMMTLFAAPSFATEGGGGSPAGEEEGNGKIGLPETQHDQVGLILLGVTGLFVLAAGANAVKQYRGTRPQADGKIRWR